MSLRTRNKELSAVCKYAFYIAQWYAAHVGRGKWQEARIEDHKKMLFAADKQGRFAIFTIDFKGKTVPDKKRMRPSRRRITSTIVGLPIAILTLYNGK